MVAFFSAAFHSTSVKTWHTKKLAPLWLPRTANASLTVMLGIQICFVFFKIEWGNNRKHIHVKNIILRSINFPNITQLKIWASHCISQWQMKMLHLHHGWPKTSRFFSAMKTLEEAACSIDGTLMEPWRFGRGSWAWRIMDNLFYHTISRSKTRIIMSCKAPLSIEWVQEKGACCILNNH